MKSKSLLKLLALGFLVFVLDAAVLRQDTVDFLLLFTVFGACRGGLKGGLVMGCWSGILAGSVDSLSIFQVVVFYALVGYIAAILLDLLATRTTVQKTVTSLVLAMQATVVSNALFTPGGLTSVADWNTRGFFPHAVVFFMLLVVSASFNDREEALARRIAR